MGTKSVRLNGKMYGLFCTDRQKFCPQVSSSFLCASVKQSLSYSRKVKPKKKLPTRAYKRPTEPGVTEKSNTFYSLRLRSLRELQVGPGKTNRMHLRIQVMDALHDCMKPYRRESNNIKTCVLKRISFTCKGFNWSNKSEYIYHESDPESKNNIMNAETF